MSIQPNESAPSEGAPPAAPRQAVSPAARLNLIPPTFLVALYWGAYWGLGAANLPTFPLAMVRAGVLLLVALTLLVWWLSRKAIPWRARLAAPAVLILGGAVAIPLLHETVLAPSVILLVVQFALTFWLAWLFFTRGAASRARVVGMSVIALALWASTLTVRMEGLKGNGNPDFKYRWAASGEELFRSQGADAATAGADLPDFALDPANAWIGFRGPNRDSTIAGLTIDADWKASPPKEIWRIRVGPAWSSMVVVGGRLYTQEQRGDEEAVVCYNAANGAEIWAHKDQARFEEILGGNGPRATPQYADGVVYALGAEGALNALDAVSGDLKWSRDVRKYSADGLPTWAYSSSPLVVDGKVIVCAGNDFGEGETEEEKKTENVKKLLAYDTATGEPVWSTPVGEVSYSSAQWVTLDGVSQILFPAQSQLTSLDPATGAILWSRAAAGTGISAMSIQPQAISDTEILASSSAETGVERLAVTRDGDSWQVEPLWTSTDLKPFYSDFVVHGDSIYGFNNDVFTCVDLATGERRWKKGRYGTGQVLLLSDQPLLIVLSEAGELILVKPDAGDLIEVARLQAIEGKTWNHPALAGSRLYVRNAEWMACFELAAE
jgi:outer membrane protein assembly factor BamB